MAIGEASIHIDRPPSVGGILTRLAVPRMIAQADRDLQKLKALLEADGPGAPAPEPA